MTEVAGAAAPLLGSDGLLEALTRALRDAPADEAELWVHRRRAAVTRYSHSSIHQNAVSDEIHVQARTAVGRAVGIASGNSLEEGALRRLLGDAAALAREQRPNERWPGLSEPAPCPPAHAYDAATASAGPMEQAALVSAVCDAASRRGFRAAGTCAIDVTEDAVANTHGVALHAPCTVAHLRALVQSDVGSGYAENLGWRLDALDAADVAARASDKCARDRDRSSLGPGDYEAVFEELAVAEILRIVSITGLSGELVLEDRSFLSGRTGEAVTGERFTLHDDARDPRMAGIPFDVEGTPKRRVTAVERGRAVGPVHDRYSAARAGTSSTGHAADPRRYPPGGHAGNLVMEGGSATRDELIGSVTRGILITRFHYTNTPDPKSAAMTGTTRDGTFLIEDGRVVAALPNLRYTMSALDLFAGIELLGPQRLARDWWSSNGMGSIVCLVPPMKVSRATITGASPLSA
ncbi:MAG: TldD/PmbA family protein [Chloroflexota bacterium]|nr:TldD/PmbA family protein [Chloroflexota bacterium]